MNRPLTDAQRRALAVLLEAGERGIRPRQVARVLWPDSPAWERRTRFMASAAKNQGAVGGTMPMKAAQLLWRLWDRGCAQQDDGTWRITERGRRVLAGTAEPRPLPERPKPESVERPRKEGR